MSKFIFIFVILFLPNELFAKNSRAHFECIKASDYKGCVREFKKLEKQELKAYKNKFNDCKRREKNEFSQSKEALHIGCEIVAAGKNFYYEKSSPNKNCIFNVADELSKNKDVLIRKVSTPIALSNACETWEEIANKKMGLRINQNDKVDESFWWREATTVLYGGNRYFNSDILKLIYPDKNNTWDYGLNASSVKQLRIRNSYGRYLTFYGRTTNRYTGDYIPEKPSFISCDWGGSGSAYADYYSAAGSWSSDGRCYGEGGTSAVIIPGGVDKTSYEYELDCIDGTFNRKGDRDTYEGYTKKGWMKVINDPTALMAKNIYCPIISTLPRKYN